MCAGRAVRLQDFNGLHIAARLVADDAAVL